MATKLDWSKIEAVPGRWCEFALRWGNGDCEVHVGRHRGMVFGRFVAHGGNSFEEPFAVSHFKTGYRVKTVGSLVHACLLAQTLDVEAGAWPDMANVKMIVGDAVAKRAVFALFAPVRERFDAYMNCDLDEESA